MTIQNKFEDDVEDIRIIKPRKYYFVEKYYHDLTQKRQDEQEMSQYGEVGHDDKGAYWKIAQPKKIVQLGLQRLGYVLA